MLLGGGGQGKSVFLKVLGEILGRANISAASLQTIIDNRFGTAELYGRLANIAGDIPDMALSNAENFKRATGDDLVWAERKNKDPFNFWNRAKLIFSANQLPPTNDKTIGFMRRWVDNHLSREMVQGILTHTSQRICLKKGLVSLTYKLSINNKSKLFEKSTV